MVAAEAAPMAVQSAAPVAAKTAGAATTGATTSTGLNLLGADVAANPGIIGKMMSSKYAAPALITTGGQLIGGAMQGYGMREEQKRQEQLAGEARDRYNTNVGTRLWG